MREYYVLQNRTFRRLRIVCLSAYSTGTVLLGRKRTEKKATMQAMTAKNIARRLPHSKYSTAFSTAENSFIGVSLVQ
jgi:hypothetical protein